MMATQRPVTTGRTDTLGRGVKVAAVTAGNRSSAPPPPGAGPSKREEATRARLDRAKAAEQKAAKALQAAQVKRAEVERQVAGLRLREFKKAAEAALKTGEQQFAAYQKAVAASPRPATLEAQAARSAAAGALNGSPLGEARTNLQRVYGWNTEDAQVKALEKMADRFSTAREIEGMAAAYLRLLARGSNGRDRADVQDALTSLWAGRGPDHERGDNMQGWPCTSCGGPRTGYNDDDYYCRNCNS